MKRVLPEFLDDAEINPIKHKSNPIFNITKTELKLTGDCGSDQDLSHLSNDRNNQRVNVSSKVNFSKLSPQEQSLRFKNQLKEIKKLRAQLSDSTKRSNKVLFKGLHGKIQDYENRQQKLLINTLSSAIISEKLKPNTLGYNQICTIIRDVMNEEISDNKYCIVLPNKTLGISAIEFETYSKLKCTEGMMERILGRERTKQDDPNEILNDEKILKKIS